MPSNYSKFGKRWRFFSRKVVNNTKTKLFNRMLDVVSFVALSTYMNMLKGQTHDQINIKISIYYL